MFTEECIDINFSTDEPKHYRKSLQKNIVGRGNDCMPSLYVLVVSITTILDQTYNKCSPVIKYPCNYFNSCCFDI